MLSRREDTGGDLRGIRPRGLGQDAAQVLVWSDMAGLRGGRAPRFVKKYADLRGVLSQAARTYAAEVASGVFPAAEHSFED